MEPWTIQRLLTWITEYLTDKDVEAPRLSAELLLSNILSLKRIELYMHFGQVVEKQQLERLRDMVKRAGAHEPVAYLVGKTEFYSIEIEVNQDCLIPRPETELLVERAIEFLRGREGPQSVCDLCTGSACIAVAIAKNFPHAHVVATDISDAALAVAARNIEKYQLEDRVTLLNGDLFDPVIPHLDGSTFDLIVCNPPYVSSTEYEALDKNVREYEPALGLLAGQDGLDVYRRIADHAGGLLKDNGAIMLEVGYSQGPAVRKLVEEAGLSRAVKIEKDFNDNDRIVIAVRGENAG